MEGERSVQIHPDKIIHGNPSSVVRNPAKGPAGCVILSLNLDNRSVEVYPKFSLFFASVKSTVFSDVVKVMPFLP